MDTIPRDVQLHIFSYLSYWNLDLALVSKEWRRLFWHRRGSNLLYYCGTSRAETKNWGEINDRIISAPTANYWREYFSEVNPKSMTCLKLHIPRVDNSILQDGSLSKLLVNLETLIIDTIPQTNPDVFFNQVPLLTRLRTLKMNNHTDLIVMTPDVVQKIAACTRLESLALPYIYRLGYGQLTTLTNLQELSLFYHCNPDSRDEAQILMNSMVQLKKLHISIHSTIHSTQERMFSLKNITGLKELSMETRNVYSGDNFLDEEKGFAIAPNIQLDKLTLINVDFLNVSWPVGEETPPLLTGLIAAKEFELKYSSKQRGLFMADFDLFRNMTNLQKLRLSTWQLICEQRLDPLTNLTSLIVSGKANRPDDFGKLFESAPNLKQFYIQRTSGISAYDFKDLGLLNQLDSLRIYGIRPEDENAMERLKAKNLKILGLDASRFSQQYFDRLGNFDSLTSLSLTEINNDDRSGLDLTKIFALPNLEILYLQFETSVATEDYEKWMAAAYNTKLRYFILRIDIAEATAWEKIFQIDKWKWIQLSDAERAHNYTIEEISAFDL